MDDKDKINSRIRFWWVLREKLFQEDNKIKMNLSSPSKDYSFVVIPFLEIFDIEFNIQFRENNIIRLAIQTKDENIHNFLVDKQKDFSEKLNEYMDYPDRKKFKQLYMEKNMDLNNSNEKEETLKWITENILKIRKIFLK